MYMIIAEESKEALRTTLIECMIEADAEELTLFGDAFAKILIGRYFRLYKKDMVSSLPKSKFPLRLDTGEALCLVQELLLSEYPDLVKEKERRVVE